MTDGAVTDLADELAIRRTIDRYAQLCDDGRFDEWEQLFTDDTAFVALGQTHRGRAAARAFMEQFQGPDLRGKHMCANTLVDVDGDRATSTTDFVFYAKSFEVLSIGRYHDVLVRADRGWRFASREITFLVDP